MTIESVWLSLKQQPKTWLVTGCAGFIGSNLVQVLLQHDQTVLGIDNFSTGYQANLDAIQAIVNPSQWQQFSFYEGDICDQALCFQLMQGVDYVLHQAALGSVPRSIEDPIATNQANITGFLNVLNCARLAGVSNFVYAASSSTYGDHPDLPKREDTIGAPLSPYAITKYVNELYADIFAKTYGFYSIGLRYFNVFGYRQNPNGAYAAVIPKWLQSMRDQEPVFINGDGTTSRDFCFIDNAVQANILAAVAPVKDLPHHIFNVAFGQQTSLNQLFELLQQALQQRFKLEVAPAQYRQFRQGDVKHSLASIERAQQLLGYQPQFSMAQGIQALVNSLDE